MKEIFTRVLSAEIIVEPAGGSSPAAAAQFLLCQRGGRAAYILDRDYRRREVAEPSFHDGTNRFIWRRHSIENYHLPPPLIVRAFRRLRERAEKQFAGHLPAWATALPTDVGQVVNALRACAHRRAAEEASRLAVHRLWEDLSNTAGRVQKRVPPLPPGRAADDLDSWRDAIQQETQRLREAANQAATSPHLETDNVLRRLEEIPASITAEAYLGNLEFLIDFHGRDLLEEFRHWLEQLGVRLSYQRLEQELIDVVGEVYAGDRTIYGTDDFLDLANGARSLAALPPLT